MRISPKYKTDAWEQLTFCNEDDWGKGINIFEDRMRGRYFYPINLDEKKSFLVLQF